MPHYFRRICLSIVCALISGCIYRSPVPDGKQVIRPECMNTQTQVFDFKLSDASGRAHSLSDYKGKFVLINFFATWCKTCVYELPALANLYERLKDKGFMVIGVSIDDDRSDFTRFAKEKNLPFPLLFDSDSEAREAYKVYSIPSSFFVDKNGRSVSFYDPISHTSDIRVDGFQPWDSAKVVEGFGKCL